MLSARGLEFGGQLGKSGIVVLAPETWIGQRFPLVAHIDIGDQLAEGLWLVLLHRPDCSACRDAVSQYELLAQDFSTNSGCPRIALIQLPPYAPDAKTIDDVPWVSGHLNDAKQWRLSGPVSVLIESGQVQSAFMNARDVELLVAIWGMEH